jgi:hypothetical protein
MDEANKEVKNMYEDEINQIKKAREDMDKARIEFEGMMKIIKATKLNGTGESIVMILEKMMEGFIAIGYRLSNLTEDQFHLSRHIENLQKEVKELKETLDTFQENK